MACYVHFSPERLSLRDLSEARMNVSAMTDFKAKPGGFWFTAGVGEDKRWSEYRKAAGDSSELFQYRYQVRLVHAAKLFYVRDVSTRDWLTLRYGSSGSPAIDWPRLAQQHVGVVVEPYPTEWREDLHRS